jgi:hypothetical protein
MHKKAVKTPVVLGHNQIAWDDEAQLSSNVEPLSIKPALKAFPKDKTLYGRLAYLYDLRAAVSEHFTNSGYPLEQLNQHIIIHRINNLLNQYEDVEDTIQLKTKLP